MSGKLITSRGILADLTRALSQGTYGWVPDLCMKMTSDQAAETYAWLGQSPAMQEWLGGRSAKDLREFSFAITNKDFEATLEITVPEMRRAKSNAFDIRIADLANRVNAFPAKLATTLIIAAEAKVCYDGQYFFDTDHAEGDSGTQDNDLTYAAATGTTPTVDEMKGAILQSVTKMFGFKDDRGELMNENAKDFLVMVPLVNYATAVEAVNMPTSSAGGANLLQNLPEGIRINVSANGRLDQGGWSDKMATFARDSEMKPFILQEELPLHVSALAEGSDLEFNENKHLYGVDWAGNVGLGFWQKACLTTFT